MTILLQRLFLVIFLFGSLLSGVDGQSKGIFKDKSKVEGGGGQCPGCPPCAWFDEIPEFGFDIELEGSDYPCDLYVGITFENGHTQYASLSFYNGRTIPFFPPNYQGCMDGRITVNYTVDLYCFENDVMTPIVPCESDDFDDLLPDDIEDECSLSTLVEFSVCCYGGGTSSEPEPNLPIPESPIRQTFGRNSDCQGDSRINIFSLDGRNVYGAQVNETEERFDMFQDLNIKSGLYFIVTEKCGVLTTQKVFKN